MSLSFLSGAAEHGVPAEAAAALFEEIVGFANYAFNKSHAAAYGVLSYRSAYLKAHYPRQYISALMTSVLGDSDKLAEYIGECARLGIRILPPHVNDSAWDFHVDGANIRFGKMVSGNIRDGIVNVISGGDIGYTSESEVYLGSSPCPGANRPRPKRRICPPWAWPLSVSGIGRSRRYRGQYSGWWHSSRRQPACAQ